MTEPGELEERIRQYQLEFRVERTACLGAGTQGSVFVVNQPSRPAPVAVKFHNREVGYQRERDVYFRLRDMEVLYVRDHRVPLLIRHHDHLLALEMTIVSPPFVLDFGGAYLDRPADYSEEVWEDWRIQKEEAFEENWPAVQRILGAFKAYGIFIADVNPGNIRF